MTELIVILLVVGIIALTWHLIAIRERALNTAKKYCHKMNVQFLDGSVSPSGYGLARNKQGAISIEQKFLFEFSSTGERRYKGNMIFIGSQMIHIELEPHIMHDNDEGPEEIAHDNTQH